MEETPAAWWVSKHSWESFQILLSLGVVSRGAMVRQSIMEDACAVQTASGSWHVKDAKGFSKSGVGIPSVPCEGMSVLSDLTSSSWLNLLMVSHFEIVSEA